jgi:hypothetical protein
MNGKTLKEKAVPTAAVVLSLAAAFLFFQRFNPEVFFKYEGEPVSLETIRENPSVSYAGRLPGADIPQIASIEDFEAVMGNQHVTPAWDELEGTGVYGLKPWVDPYSITKARSSSGHLYSTGRKAPEVIRTLTVTADSYREYCLLKLADSSYILAQLPANIQYKAEKGEKAAFPVGIKKTNSDEVRSELSEICAQYGADTTYTLYMVDDEWDQEQHFTIFIIRLGASALLFFVLAVGLVLAAGKLFHR